MTKLRPGCSLWTEDDINFLIGNAEVLPVEEIAKRLNRTVSSIKGKALMMQISLAPTLDNLSTESLARLLGVNGNTVCRWIANGELKSTKAKNTKRSRHRISRRNFKSFYKRCKDKKPSLARISPAVLEWLVG